MDYIKIIIGSKMFRVPPQEVLYIEADGNYINIHLTSEGRPYFFGIQLGNMMKLLDTLHDNPFIHVGRSLIVNKDYIRMIMPNEQILRLSTNAMAGYVDLNPSREALRTLIETLSNEGGEQ